MKKILICLRQEDLLTTLELILKHWGYRVIATHRPEDLPQYFTDGNPDFLLVESRLAAHPEIGRLVDAGCRRTGCPVVLIGPPGDCRPDTSGIRLDVPVDIFKLFCIVQQHLEPLPRNNFRIAVRVPGMVMRAETTSLVEILSISVRGIFIKTSLAVSRGEEFRLVLPLLGMKRELELTARVIYIVEPCPENRYQQGIGLEFRDLDAEATAQLEAFLEQRLLKELEEKHGHIEIDLTNIRQHTCQNGQPDPGRPFSA
ncbi:PilZ domain-containing protein [Geothermobacter ehrlichii]|uniref:PilZ domain-containing protein n=1 Tax=Geothermobacter ehrlichii TaxID=213224 RepID=A0A5D3WHG7_9BACT|nr:PilZ domain-containing protein [Geothermobacter ehrlichii]TYO98236.1 PilZ domain-containing protein [Geothermobacter ehrlichii]